MFVKSVRDCYSGKFMHDGLFSVNGKCYFVKDSIFVNKSEDLENESYVIDEKALAIRLCDGSIGELILTRDTSDNSLKTIATEFKPREITTEDMKGLKYEDLFLELIEYLDGEHYELGDEFLEIVAGHVDLFYKPYAMQEDDFACVELNHGISVKGRLNPTSYGVSFKSGIYVNDKLVSKEVDLYLGELDYGEEDPEDFIKYNDFSEVVCDKVMEALESDVYVY